MTREEAEEFWASESVECGKCAQEAQEAAGGDETHETGADKGTAQNGAQRGAQHEGCGNAECCRACWDIMDALPYPFMCVEGGSALACRPPEGHAHYEPHASITYGGPYAYDLTQRLTESIGRLERDELRAELDIASEALAQLRAEIRDRESERADLRDRVTKAEAGLADAWDEGHRTPQRRELDECRCAAWNASECGCGLYGTGRIITPNPYRAALKGGDDAA